MAQSENRLESFTQCGGLAAKLHSSFGEARESNRHGLLVLKGAT